MVLIGQRDNRMYASVFLLLSIFYSASADTLTCDSTYPLMSILSAKWLGRDQVVVFAIRL